MVLKSKEVDELTAPKYKESLVNLVLLFHLLKKSLYQLLQVNLKRLDYIKKQILKIVIIWSDHLERVVLLELKCSILDSLLGNFYGRQV